MSRPKGTINLTEKQLSKIITLSENPNIRRGEIAEKVGCSKRTVYVWQKKLELL